MLFLIENKSSEALIEPVLRSNGRIDGRTDGQYQYKFIIIRVVDKFIELMHMYAYFYYSLVSLLKMVAHWMECSHWMECCNIKHRIISIANFSLSLSPNDGEYLLVQSKNR